ncbi:MAG: hypothetical protein HYU67_06330 [Flavobacteriia bacterium]|nr:hypothetical protein [Flavobacteriia bacterium]
MTQEEYIANKIETDKFIVAMRTDNIVHVFYKDNLNIDKPTLKELVFAFNEICNGLEHCFIFEAGKNVKMNNEARNYTFELEILTPFKATCVIAQNKFYKLLAEFFYYIKKPIKPYNFFTKFEEGIEWLKKFQN